MNSGLPPWMMKTTILFVALMELAHAQAPTSAIAGVVRDPSGLAVAGVRVKVASPSTGLERSVTVSEQGDYSFPALLAGEYEVSVAAQGFQRIVRTPLVEAGATTTPDFALLDRD